MLETEVGEDIAIAVATMHKPEEVLVLVWPSNDAGYVHVQYEVRWFNGNLVQGGLYGNREHSRSWFVKSILEGVKFILEHQRKDV